MVKSYKGSILLAVLIVTVVFLLYMGPIPQDPSYHNFADQRLFFSIPNFWDVMSNLPMFFIGLYGIYISLKSWEKRPDLVAKLIPVILCVGIFTACFGSAYYHWAPENNTLVWDRLPMTLMFMPLFALVIYDFMGEKIGRPLFWVLIPLGILSVWYWHVTELRGEGDLRIYAFVQFFPMLILPFILWLYYKKTNYLKYILLILGWYIIAKLCEYFDVQIFELTGFWSGHTLKHLTASVALFYIVKLIIAWQAKWRVQAHQ